MPRNHNHPFSAAVTAAALTPGHPLERLSRHQGIPPEAILPYINQEREACLQQGIPCPWDPIIAYLAGQVREEREQMGYAGFGGGGHGNGRDGFERHGGHHGKAKHAAGHHGGRRHGAQEQEDGEDAPRPGRGRHHPRGGGQHNAPTMTEESEKSPREA
ncbi:MAG: hypothetical protein Q9172_003883, partial [Xanthocarpia lactea]